MFRLGPRACPAVRKSGRVSKTDSIFVETVRRLREATALGGVAQMLAETTEPPVRTARKLKGIAPNEWLTFERATPRERFLSTTSPSGASPFPARSLMSGLWSGERG